MAASAASAAFITAGWRSKQNDRLAPAGLWYGTATEPLALDAAMAPRENHADVGAALRLVLRRLAPVMASQLIRADIAAPVGLLVRIRAVAVVDLLQELLAIVFQGAPASRILLTAAARGEGIYIGISDDMPGADANVRRASVRALMEQVAIRGGVLDVDVRPAEGTTMTLRLPAVRTDNPVRAVAAPVRSDLTKRPARPFFSSDTSR